METKPEPPLSLLAQAAQINNDFVNSTGYEVMPYVHRQRGEQIEWRFQIVHQLTRDCLCQNLFPEKADAHTYMLLIHAADSHGNKMHDQGEADALSLLYQHFAKVIAIKPSLQLRTIESAVAAYRQQHPEQFVSNQDG